MASRRSFVCAEGFGGVVVAQRNLPRGRRSQKRKLQDPNYDPKRRDGIGVGDGAGVANRRYAVAAVDRKTVAGRGRRDPSGTRRSRTSAMM